MIPASPASVLIRSTSTAVAVWVPLVAMTGLEPVAPPVARGASPMTISATPGMTMGSPFCVRNSWVVNDCTTTPAALIVSTLVVEVGSPPGA